MRPIQNLLVLVCLAVAFTGCSHPGKPRTFSCSFPYGFQLTAPASRLVYQRGLDGTALLPIAGASGISNGTVEARLNPAGSINTGAPWQPLGNTRPDGRFDARLRVPAGWYRLDVEVRGGSQMACGTVSNVGVGEVFIVVGHSVAQGGDINLAGATDDRVNTIAWPTNSETTLREYERTADPQLLPPFRGTQFGAGVVPAPFGHGTYFWAQFAERVARTQDVPVLLLNAAFGGTSLEHWAKSARGEPFEHSFVKSELRMPYINLQHALRRYASVTGVRAILADQGQNDWPETDGGKVFANYATWVAQARTDLGFPELAVVVNRATPPGTRTTIREVQERVIREIPFCFPGPDYDTLAPADRYDHVHLSAAGLPHAAQLWAEALPASFFSQVKPYLPVVP